LTRNDHFNVEVFPIWEDGFLGCWTWDSKNAASNLKLLVARKVKERWKVYRKSYSKGSEKMLKTILNDKRYYTEKGQAEFNDLFESKDKIFQAPKSVELLESLLKTRLELNDTVVDFFSGSGTTAQAVMQLNTEDGGSRKFVAIQLPEILSEENEVQKNAYEFLKANDLPTTLDYIGIERIKRAATKINQEHPDEELDLGFKHYILSEPNQNTLDKLDSFDKAVLLVETSILDDFGKPTILATWMNADGYGLTETAQAIELAGYTAYHYQKHLYLIDGGFTLDSMKALLSKYDAEGHFNPENLVLFGYSFPEWSINEMIEKNLRILNDGEKNLKVNITVRY
jgi:type III restriction enzyme/adenine-specific DNA-methyltransferase